MDYKRRQDNLIRLLENRSLDALLIRKRQNISYLLGSKGEDSILIASRKKNFLLTDSRYKEEYSNSIKGCCLKIIRPNDAYECIETIAKKNRLRRVGFESNNFSYSEYAGLKKNLINIVLRPVKDMVESLRMIKEDDEVRCIKVACKYGCDAMNHGLKTVKNFLSERAVKNRIEGYMLKRGLRRAGFDIIVASGENASKPHASISDKKIKKGEMVIIDLGTMNYGYNSDLTRTVFLGRIYRKYLRIYNIVLDAQRRAIENIKPGVKAKHIDAISRRYISSKGLGKYFIHSLGHGIGLETHEEPHISGNSSAILEKNMIITIEPGVYIPGWGGVRIEDVVRVTEEGYEVLSDGSSRKALCG
ncbi:M24 family metallopeptidase [Candidatus Omnitrophota bacterium]